MWHNMCHVFYSTAAVYAYLPVIVSGVTPLYFNPAEEKEENLLNMRMLKKTRKCGN